MSINLVNSNLVNASFSATDVDSDQTLSFQTTVTDAGDTRAEFDFVRFATTAPTSQSNCLDEFDGLGNQ